MTQEAVPDEAVPAQAASPRQAAPKGLLQQMEELMAALNADLTQLDADLQSADRSRTAGPGAGAAPDVSGAADADGAG